ncbi:Cytoplasmic GTPase/eEF2-like protein (ribosomal biogenesis) [Oleoguttula sp. CCFEE 5521]
MPVVPPEKLVQLQQQGQNIRNICILAHVDHGKTSLTDALIATNGIISPKLAGKIRYLDSRPDEQLRGITMESSAISLFFSLLRRESPTAEPKSKEYLINLIDSPGHIDFSSEVSTASRLCDGAVVLVDAVEGVCSQTVTVLRHTYVEKLKPLLVINKMDRLITELKLSPSEAYTHLSKLLEQVNAVMGSFALGERMEDDLRWRERIDEKLQSKATESSASSTSDRKSSIASDENGVLTDDTPAQYEEKEDEDIYFEPERSNVIFSSAIDGWAFTPGQFAGIYAKKLGMKREVLEKFLWGDFYLDPKTKRVLSSKHLKGRHLKPMFVQLVLENVWAVYEVTTGGPNGKGDPTMLEKITKSLNISIPAHVLRSRDPKALLSAVFAAWLPLSTALLVSVVEHLPSPPMAQASRMPALLKDSPGHEHIDLQVREAMVKSDAASNAPVVAYVSKMVSIPESELPVNKRRGGALTAEEARELGRKKRAEIARAQAAASSNGDSGVEIVTDALSTTAISDEQEVPSSETVEEPSDPEHLIGFARLFSGTLSVGQEIYVLPPKFSPAQQHPHPPPRKVTTTALYLLMGRSLESLTSVPAGNIVGIAGLEGAILKSGTLCSQVEGAPNLSSTAAISTNAPIVRVALEPTNPGELDKMARGLRLLEQADPAVVYEQLESGEHVILTAGELHLERCLKDLRERFARCDIQAGEAIVPYRESIVSAEEMREPHEAAIGRGRVEISMVGGGLKVKLRVIPLPAKVTEFLVKYQGCVKRVWGERMAKERERRDKNGRSNGSSESNGNAGGDDVEPAAHGDEEAGADSDRDVKHAADDSIEGGQTMSVDDFQAGLLEAFDEEKADKALWKSVISKIIAFGPRQVGPNLLIDETEDRVCDRFFHDQSNDATTGTSPLHPLLSKLTHAFQLFTSSGPLCSEPTQGIAVLLESITTDQTLLSSHSAGAQTGEILRSTRTALKSAFLDWSPRILLAMYACEIQASAEVLGRVYSVITRRRGRIISESLLEPSPNFTILALLPVAESFGFADEIRKRSAGAASPQLVYAGFEALGEDPFWVPRTEEELEDFGILGERENVAKRYVDGVRERKGLVVQGKRVVGDAEKQSTLKR